MPPPPVASRPEPPDALQTVPLLTATPAPPAPPQTPPGPTQPTITPPPRRPRNHRALKWIAAGLAAILVITVVGGYAVYRHLNGNITHYDAASRELIKRPPKLTKAQNILLIGSDTRSFKGGGAFGGEVAGARSDTTILVHLSAGGRKAVLVSIPRDSYVEIPACRLTGSNGQSSPHHDKFNSAYSIGGPACTIAAVESLTHIRIDHWVEVNFQGFQRMVNALNGVNVCVKHAVSDPIRVVNGHYQGSDLFLHAGVNHLKGKQALAFVRARYGIGDGSDLGRIKDQQLFISAVIRKATSAGLLVDLPALYSFLDAATKSIRTDPGFGLPQLKGLADRLHGLKPDKVELVTVPFLYDAPGVPSADVAWDPTRAPIVWDALRKDTPLPSGVSAHPGTSTSPSPSASPSSGLTVPPSSIAVRVLNGTGAPGIAGHVAGQLKGQGFRTTSGNALAHNYQRTLVRYGPGRADSARTLAAAVPGATLQSDPALGASLQLVVGSDFGGVVTVPPVHASTSPSTSPSPSASPSLDVTTADQNICSA